ncbi:MAG TPA: ADOP family duplicated permease [Thermoanaerobaculia bacterium]|nr:ADOP family duplicated permease [Thermoanaerobaculia bacterium]
MIRLALRRLAKDPVFTGLAVLTLAPGIGAQVAIFSLVDTLFLRPLPVADAGRLAGVYQTRDGQGNYPLSLPDYLDYRESSTVWSGLASHYPTAPLSLATRDGSVEVNGSVVSGNYFSVLGIAPELGRLLRNEDDAAPGASPVAVISHHLWQSRFGGGAGILGRTVKLNGTAFTVVGVAPASFTGVLVGIPSDVWLPNALSAVGYRWCKTPSRDCTWLEMIGRLAPGRSLRQAQAQMTVLSGRLRAAHPAAEAGHGLRVIPLRGIHPAARPDTRRLAALMLAAVTLLLAVAGANLSGLLLARALTRRRDIAIRLALGARRRRVVSELVAEALLTSLLAGAAGALLASWFGRVIVGLYPSDVPIDLELDLRAAACACLLAILTGLIVGVVPGLQATRPRLLTALEDAASAVGKGRPRLLGFLIAVQVALSFVLLTGTGLLARSVANAGSGGGFDPHGVVTLRLRPRLIGHGPEKAQAESREALRRLAGLPGVHAASLAVVLPPWLPGDPVLVELPGRQPGARRGAPTAWSGAVAPAFFRTFGAPILRGRDFDDRDRAGSPAVAIVNLPLARRLWPAGEAVGQQLVVAGRVREVVGLVPDMGYRNALEAPAAQVYVPYWQDASLVDARLCVRAAGDPSALVPAMLRELHAIDPELPVTEVEPLTAGLDRFLAPVRVAGRVLAAAAGLALLLSAVGLYGVLSLTVVRRTREIGIRMALGGSRSQVVALVVRDATVLVAFALALGLTAALGAGGLLAHDLYGVGPRDPLTFVDALALLVLTAAVASWLPARRASRVDPLAALRQG